MTESPIDERRAHWERVYHGKSPVELSWFQEHPTLSMDLMAATGLGADAAIVDVGGGASVLADHLLAAGFTNIAVLDVADGALAQARHRLAERSELITWITTDVTTWRPDRRYDLWHDRAVLHFLTDPADQAAYGQTLRAVLKPGGWAIIAGFAPGGPERCSGLPIVQHAADSLRTVLGNAFVLVEARDERHVTPRGATQAFRSHLLRFGV